MRKTFLFSLSLSLFQKFLSSALCVIYMWREKDTKLRRLNESFWISPNLQHKRLHARMWLKWDRKLHEDKITFSITSTTDAIGQAFFACYSTRRKLSCLEEKMCVEEWNLGRKCESCNFPTMIKEAMKWI
jgi:hypothetical protein